MRYGQLLTRETVGGTVWLCQLGIVDKARKEPAAAAMLYGLLAEIKTRPDGDELYPVAVAPHAQQVLDQWEVVLAGAQSGPGEMLDGARLARAWPAEKDLMKRLDSGGFIWVSVPEITGFKALDRVVPGFELVPGSFEDGPPLFVKDHPLARSGLDQDLAWLAPHPVYSQRAAKRIVPSRFRLTRRDVGSLGGPGWQPVVEPGLVWARRMGRGWLVVDTIDWTERAKRSGSRFKSKRATLPEVILDPEVNGEKGMRVFGTLLGNLGVRGELKRDLVLEGENFPVRTPEQPLVRNRNHHFWGMFENSELSGARISIGQGRGGGHTVDVTARCRTGLKISPVMELVMDGTVVGRCPVHRNRWRTYRFNVDMDAGDHVIGVRLINNPDDPYNHRYLHVDRVVVRPKGRN